MHARSLTWLCAGLATFVLLVNWRTTENRRMATENRRMATVNIATATIEKPRAALFAPTRPLPPPPPPRPLQLVSAGRPAHASVRGNLGPASVVTRTSPPKDWLHDRWQAARDMNGTPLPGAQWVAVELEAGCVARAAVLDWETAHADDYELQERIAGLSALRWQTLEATRVSRNSSHQHVVDKLQVLHHDREARNAVGHEYRVYIRKPATQWGVSLWRFELWGECADTAASPPQAPLKCSWPELVGARAASAVATIAKERLTLMQVITLPEDATVTADFREERVRVFTDTAGRVAKMPVCG